MNYPIQTKKSKSGREYFRLVAESYSSLGRVGKIEENSVSTFGRIRLWTSFKSSPVSVKFKISEISISKRFYFIMKNTDQGESMRTLSKHSPNPSILSPALISLWTNSHRTAAPRVWSQFETIQATYGLPGADFWAMSLSTCSSKGSRSVHFCVSWA